MTARRYNHRGFYALVWDSLQLKGKELALVEKGAYSGCGGPWAYTTFDSQHVCSSKGLGYPTPEAAREAAFVDIDAVVA